MSKFVFLTSSKKYVFAEGENLAQALGAIVADPQKGYGKISSIVVPGGVAAYVADLFEATETKEVGSGRNATFVDTGILKRPLKEGLVLLTLKEVNEKREAVIVVEEPALGIVEAEHEAALKPLNGAQEALKEAKEALKGAKLESKAEEKALLPFVKSVDAAKAKVDAVKSKVDAVKSKIDAANNFVLLADEAAKAFDSVLPKPQPVPAQPDIMELLKPRRYRKVS